MRKSKVVVLGLILLFFLLIITGVGAYFIFQSVADTAEELLFSYEMSPDECLPGEKYGSEEKLCYLDCDTDAECDALYDEILVKAEEVGEDYFDGEKDYSGENDEGTTITRYDIDQNSLGEAQDAEVDSDLAIWQDDRAKHQELWKRFITLIPLSFRGDITVLEIYTDGKEEGLAAVSQDTNDPEKWVLFLDIIDAYPNGTLDSKDFTYSLIHEFGHILTLNRTQVDIDKELFSAATDDEYGLLFDRKANSCPRHFLMEGCTREGSYFNSFFQRFWINIHAEQLDIELIEDEDKYYDALDDFYIKYEDQFITDYAATNPGEDITESWTAFVLKEKPSGSSVSDQKVSFFYAYPELVKLRDIIRARL